MAIKLSKACKELNVGLDTIVDFFKKKGHEVKTDLNTRIGEDLYIMLAQEFNKEVAAKLISKANEPAPVAPVVVENPVEVVAEESTTSPEPELVKVDVNEVNRPQFKEVGMIDLDNINSKKKKEVETTPEPIVEKAPEAPKPVVKEVVVETKQEALPVVEKKPEVKAEAPAPVPVVEEVKVKVVAEPKKEEKAPEVKVEPVVETPKVEVKPEVKAEEPVAKPAAKAEPEVFTASRPIITKSPTVVGQIDLSSINLSTRPKSKTKEEKKKERELKNKQFAEQKRQQQAGRSNGQQTGTATAAAGDQPKKKRERIKVGKVDITKPQQDQHKAAKKKGDNRQNTRPLKTEVNEEDVQKQIKETLARLSGAKNKTKGSRYRKEKRENVRASQEQQMQRDRAQETVLQLTEFVTANELAVMMDISVNQVISTCMSIGMMVSINQRLDAETINIVAEEFGFTTEYVSADVVESIGSDEEQSAPEDMEPRSPIVTVMGHVDHGKTSLLDYIRKANVIAGEAGGITQHIGAYNVTLDSGQKITFLDTPGHEAFTAMRARGAKVTDIAIIIVAADDDVMPQTREAINHASAAGVPMVFAINKVDKTGANPEKIKEALATMNYLVEEWGGKYQSQDISAKHGKGISELLEKVLLEAEMLELKANPNRRAVGSVIESSLDKGRGYVATVLVQDGTLRMGDVVLAGTHHGKIKAMFNERNQRIQEARPGEPVLILGLSGAPQAGDNFNVMQTEQEAREIANKREQLQREQSIRTKKHFTLDELGRRIALGDFKELNVIVKGDVDGSVEALSDSLIKLSTEHIQVNVIHKAVGAISESDILLAAASNAIICGFQVRPVATARRMAEQEEIDIRLYSVIYDAIEEIKSAMEGMLAPDIKEEITATLEIQEVFKITKVGMVAGCIVREGKIKRNNKVRIIRDGIVTHTGELASLKRMKDDVKEVGTNFECGLHLRNYNDLKIGDIVESFEEVEVKKTL